MKWAFLVAVLYGAALVVSGDDGGSLDFDLPDVERPAFPKIPGLENLPINTSALPSAEEAEKLFKEKCIKNGGDEAYNVAKNARNNAESCVRSLINYTQLLEEMEEAKPTGDLDRVFRSYCKKAPQFKDCIMDFVNSTNMCLTESERGSKQLVQNVTEQLLGFVCFKEGDRIALFIAEKGPECLSDKKEAIFHCVNATFGKHIPAGTPNINALPQLLLGADECQDVCALQRCVVRELEKCEEPTPANVIQSMFDYVLKVTPCTNCKAQRISKTSSSGSRFKFDYVSLALSIVLVTFKLV